jgi:hypothetical protein
VKQVIALATAAATGFGLGALAVGIVAWRMTYAGVPKKAGKR